MKRPAQLPKYAYSRHSKKNATLDAEQYVDDLYYSAGDNREFPGHKLKRVTKRPRRKRRWS